MKYEEVIRRMVQSCVQQGCQLAQRKTNAGVFRPLSLYYKPSSIIDHGSLMLIDDSDGVPTGFIRACPESLSGGVPYENYFSWINGRVARLPILQPLLWGAT